MLKGSSVLLSPKPEPYVGLRALGLKPLKALNPTRAWGFRFQTMNSIRGLGLGLRVQGFKVSRSGLRFTKLARQ